MTEQQEGQSQSKEKSGKLRGILSSIAVFLVIVFGAKFLGRQAGRQAAIQAVQHESFSQNAPIGFMGAKWLMSMTEVKSLFPDATEFSPGNLKFETSAFSRPAFVDLMFNNNLLLMVIITFKGEKTESTYIQTHDLVVQEYGAFPETSSTNEKELIYRKRIGRITIEHVLYEQFGMPIEQVMLYRTKAG